VPDFIGVFRQFDAGGFGFAGGIEQADFDLGGIGGKQGEVDAMAVPMGAERMRQAFPQPCLKLRLVMIGHW
jgi:hypothetical protein